jgi:putative inorganic carbon (hco3(-)) transporter
MAAAPATATTRSPVVWIRRSLIALVALMPFHAFGSVWLGSLFGHQAVWQSWKEVLIVVLAVWAAVIVWREPARRQRLRNHLVYLAGGFTLISLIVTAANHPHLTPALYGLKTDVEFLVVFVLAMVVADKQLVAKLSRVVVATSGAVIAFGLLQIYVLPKDWLTHFGYGATTIQPYFLVDPAVRSIRILSTLGGPNQLGGFLILPLCLVAWQLLHKPRWWQGLYLGAGLIVEWHTYSRSALIGLAAAFLIIGLLRTTRRWRLPLLLVATILAAIAINLLTTDAGNQQDLQYYLFHQTTRNTGIQASTDQHASAYQQGLRVASAHPLGTGLGTAGPASLHSTHPFIPEDYYLQLAIETGVLGLVVFGALEVLLGLGLWHIGATTPGAAATVATLVGIGVVNLVLHGWADSSTALVFWSFAGAIIGATA